MKENIRLASDKSFVYRNQLEKKYNALFNKYKINDPVTSFRSITFISLFKNKMEYKDSDSYLEYSDFLNIALKEKGIMKEEKLDLYFENLKNQWVSKLSQYDSKYIHENEMKIYLVKKFIVDPIQGYIREKTLFNEINKRNIPIDKSNDFDDMDKCVDFKIKVNNLDVYIQVKPISFFKSIDTTCKFSLEKIIKAKINYDIPIFLCSVENNKISFLIQENSNDHLFKSVDDFLNLLNIYNNIGKLNLLSINSLTKPRITYN